MADNTTLNTGSGGDIIATDDISGVKYQRVKLTLGADGINSGDLSAKNPMPVDDITKTSDVFQQDVVSNRYNQIEIEYSITDPDSITDITVTKANGGDAINSNGQAVFSTSTNTNGSVKVVTNSSISYRPHFEVYAAFSCIFSAGLTSSYQRIGIYDSNNGFFIGYEGTSFGITIRKATSDTTTAQASFNVDTLTGTTGSKYTRGGIPESLDTSKDNLYRIRFGWLGAAPISFEVLSPDGEWVLFHTIKHPNTSTGTSINSPDLPLTLDLKKTSAGATNLTMSTACWAAGTTSDMSKVGGTITDNTLVKPVRSVLVAKKPNGSYTNIEATAGGNLKVSIEESAAIPVTDNGGSLTVDNGGTFAVQAAQNGTWNINNVSGTISLPTGAATSAKQPALGTAGTASADVITVQGISGMTAIKVDGSGVTQPVSGTVTANAGTGTMNVSVQNASIPITDNGGSLTVDNGGTFAVQAAQSGTWSTRTQDGSGNSVTSRATGSARPFDVAIVDGSGNQVTSFGGGTQYADGATVATPTGTAALGFDGTNVQVLSTNATGHLNIADGGNSITVDGTVNAAQSGTWNVGLNAGSNAIGSITNTSFAATQATAANLNATVVGTGTFAVQAAQSGTWNIGTLTSITNTVTVDTELATAAALADGAANPTTATAGAANIGWNGTTWDRLKTSSGIDGNGAIDGTGVLAVKLVPKRVNPANLGTATNSAVSVDVHGYSAVTVSINTTTTGTFVIEGTGDNTNWGFVEAFDIFSDLWISGQSLTPTTGKVYNILCSGLRQLRIRTNATLGATVANFWTLDNSNQYLAGIDTGAAPHNFGYTLIHKDAEYSTTQTGTAFWTPASGKKFVVTDLTISTGGTTSGIVTLWQGASADTTYTVGTDPAIFRGEFAPSATVKPGMVKSFNVPYISTTADHILRVTTSAGITVYIQVNGYEI